MNENKINIEGRIREIRTSADGDYDFSCNCWATDVFIIVTDKRSIKDTQYILKRINNKEMYEAFLEYNKKEAQDEFERGLSEAGIDIADEDISAALAEAYRQVALA